MLKRRELQGFDINQRERFYDSSYCESETEGELEKKLMQQGLARKKSPSSKP